MDLEDKSDIILRLSHAQELLVNFKHFVQMMKYVRMLSLAPLTLQKC